MIIEELKKTLAFIRYNLYGGPLSPMELVNIIISWKPSLIGIFRLTIKNIVPHRAPNLSLFYGPPWTTMIIEELKKTLAFIRYNLYGGPLSPMELLNMILSWKLSLICIFCLKLKNIVPHREPHPTLFLRPALDTKSL